MTTLTANFCWQLGDTTLETRLALVQCLVPRNLFERVLPTIRECAPPAFRIAILEETVGDMVVRSPEFSHLARRVSRALQRMGHWCPIWTTETDSRRAIKWMRITSLSLNEGPEMVYQINLE
jgi:hypothetical protein